MTPVNVRQLVERTAASSVAEDRHTLHVLEARLEASALAEWADLQARPVEAGAERVIARYFDDDDSPEITLNSVVDLRNRPLRVAVIKRQNANVASFYTVSGLAHAIYTDDICDGVSEIRVASEFEPFQTFATVVRPWPHNVVEPWIAPIRDSGFDRPRSLARSSGAVIPPRVRPYILEEYNVTAASTVLTKFADATASRLAMCLCSEVWPFEENGTALKAILKGTKTASAVVETEGMRIPAAAIHCAARWVFEQENEAEVRHTLLAAELARQWQQEKGFYASLEEVIVNALESAHSAYRVYIGKVSAESLRALGEVRKALTEETTRIAELASRLQGNLWRFLAAGTTAATLRVAALVLDRDKAALLTTRVLLFGVAGISAVAIGMLAWLSWRELLTASRLAARWRRHLEAVLAPSEIEELSARPINEARCAFKTVMCVVLGTGLLLVGGLVALGFVGG